MARYIGARYVPVFYENSQDASTDWEANVVYEPLTWVTLTNGHMYLSKKKVPATVGSPALNIEYWLDVANYNGFIQDLDDRLTIVEGDIVTINGDIAAANGRIDDILAHKCNIVAFGDSWLNAGGWLTGLANRLRATNSYNYGVNGAGFARVGYTTFADELTVATGALTTDEKNSITHVVVGGGINDQWDVLADLQNAVSTFFANVHTTFPNAKIYYWANWGKTNFTRDYFNTVITIKEFAQLQGAICLENTEYAMMGASAAYIENDNIHPSSTGYEYMSEVIYAAMHGQTYNLFGSGNLDSGIIHTRYATNGHVVTFNANIAATTAGDYTSGMSLGAIPIGIPASPKTALWTQLIDSSGTVIGQVSVTSNGIQIWGVDPSEADPSYVQFSIDFVGLFD